MEKSMIRGIFACDEQWGIGKGGQLPWPHNTEDLKWFKECTNDGVVVMGRNTWESLPRKPLHNRINVIVTTQKLDDSLGSVVVSIGRLFEILPQMNYNKNIWIIGGAQLAESCLPIIDEFWISRISGVYDCDTYLPRTAIELCYDLYETEIKENGLHIEKWRMVQ